MRGTLWNDDAYASYKFVNLIEKFTISEKETEKRELLKEQIRFVLSTKYAPNREIDKLIKIIKTYKMRTEFLKLFGQG